jgi:hypothetical protein
MKIFAKDIPIIERRIARGDLLGHIAEDYKCHPYAIKQALRPRRIDMNTGLPFETQAVLGPERGERGRGK